MYCEKCGTKQSIDASFCSKCGHKIQDAETVNVRNEESSLLHSSEQKIAVHFYYAVPKTKFILLFVCTLGLYQLYWFAKNWMLIRQQEKSKIKPIARAIFSILFYSDLANRVLKTARTMGYSKQYSPTFLAIAYFATSLTWRLPGAWLLIGFISFLPLIPVVQATNFINEHSEDATIDSNYHIGEIIAAILGGIYLLLMIIGFLSN